MTEPYKQSHGKRPCIGVFDSGFGGLTVLDALTRALPGANFLYLGDTARLPYGSKSAETVTRYTAAAIQQLADSGAQLVVIACNTASALALPTLEQNAPVPLIGVIAPGAAAAATAVQAQGNIDGKVLVLATEATVASHAYAAACASHGLRTFEKACPLLVPLIEEGWTEHSVTAQVADIYLHEALAQMQHGAPAHIQRQACRTNPAAILLGCTHYPLLREVLARAAAAIMPPVPIVDSAQATAEYVRTLLPAAATTAVTAPTIQFFATDSPAKFQRLGQRFLQQGIGTVTLVDLDA